MLTFKKKVYMKDDRKKNILDSEKKDSIENHQNKINVRNQFYFEILKIFWRNWTEKKTIVRCKTFVSGYGI